MANTPPYLTESPVTPSPVKRFVRRLLLWFSMAAGVLIIGLVLIAGFFEKQIGERVLEEVNKQITSELRVETIDLSLLSGFPKASVNLRNVVLADARKGTLLEAENLAFRFGLMSLFGSSVKVHSVLIEDGALFIHIDRKGRGNYMIGKKTENTVQKASMKEKDFALSIQEAKLRDVELIYIDNRIKQEIKGLVKEASLSGEFSNEAFSLNSFIEMQSSFFEFYEQRYLVGKDVLLDANLNVNFKEGRYTFTDVDLGIEANVFKVNGDIISKGSNTDFDLLFNAEDGSLASVLSLLPEQQQAYFDDFSSKGNFVFDGSIKGRLNAKENPAINARLALKRGKITSKKLKRALKDVTFHATYSNGKAKNANTSTFKIKDFKGYFNRELIESNFSNQQF